MNKELIKKYKNEFDYWVNGGKILMHYGNKWIPVALDAKWEFFISDLEEMRSFGYVIADEYVEFRKALAEGKTIQCNAREEQNDITYAAFGHNWWIDTTEFIYATRFYRIKPEEPQFKVDDWVYIPSLNGNPCQFSEDLCMLGLEKWEPQAGEWCWNYVFGLVKVICKTKTEGYFLCRNPWKRVEQTITIDEPFIGTLPTKLGKK